MLWFGRDPDPISTWEITLDTGKEMSVSPSVAIVWHNLSIGLVLIIYLA